VTNIVVQGYNGRVGGGGGRWGGTAGETGDKRRRTGRAVTNIVVQGYDGRVGGGSGGRCGGTAGGAGLRETGDKRWRTRQAVINVIVQGYKSGGGGADIVGSTLVYGASWVAGTVDERTGISIATDEDVEGPSKLKSISRSSKLNMSLNSQDPPPVLVRRCWDRSFPPITSS
jgi:hypothetical protein